MARRRRTSQIWMPGMMSVRFFSVVLIVFAASFGLGASGPAEAAPRFQDFRAGPTYTGPVHAPDLSSHPDAKTYRTQLQNAAKGGVNFAGDHVLATWGCGGQCLIGAVINARSGHVQFLPDTICCWLEAGEDINPIEFEVGSDLLVLPVTSFRAGSAYATRRRRQHRASVVCRHSTARMTAASSASAETPMPTRRFTRAAVRRSTSARRPAANRP